MQTVLKTLFQYTETFAVIKTVCRHSGLQSWCFVKDLILKPALSNFFSDPCAGHRLPLGKRDWTVFHTGPMRIENIADNIDFFRSQGHQKLSYPVV